MLKVNNFPQFTLFNCTLATETLPFGSSLNASTPPPGSKTCLLGDKMFSISIDRLAHGDIISDIFVNETNVNLPILTK